MGMGGFRFFPFIMMLIVGFIIYSLIVKTQKNSNEITSLDILKKRYTKGDINKDEYENMRKDLDI